ncbi:hypothetical protein [Mycobacterium sp.]|uniref:hypothetical protein n=1 Tax=Mycobacterium sp. TaxID=1785 RepID=UPI002BD73965|nr:hypothetical protein [Mycobacterium sp.]HTQ16254.1 hypothetical protein [Mycobacterium sp.]
MALFRKRNHAAEGDAAQGDFESLMGLSPEDLAAELMPAFGPDGPRHGKDLHTLQLVSWLLRRYRGANKVSRPAEKLYAVVGEAMQVLEHAELVQGTQSSDRGVQWNATRLGATALANGDVRQRIDDRNGP